MLRLSSIQPRKLFASNDRDSDKSTVAPFSPYKPSQSENDSVKCKHIKPQESMMMVTTSAVHDVLLCQNSGKYIL